MRITEKMNSRSMSWNRMDTNFRADQLRDVGVPEEFIDLVKGLDFAEIDQRYPEIAEWLEESAGVWNEPKMAGMFEDPNIMSVNESAEIDSLKQELKYWEDRAIQIGLIGSDQELIEADDVINEITDQIKQLESTEATGIFLVTDAHIENALRNGMSKSEYSKLKDENDNDGIKKLVNKYLDTDDSWQEGGEANPLGDSGMWNTGDPDPDNEHIGWKDMFDDVIPDEPSVATGMLDDGTGNFYCPICSRTYINMSWDNTYNHASSYHNMREDKAKDFANTMTSSLIKNAFETLPADYDWRDVHNDRVDDALDPNYNGALGMDSMVGMNLNQWGYSKRQCPNCGSEHWNPASMNIDDDRYRCTNCGTIYDNENKPISDDMSYTDQDGYAIKQTDPQIQRGQFSFTAGGVPDITPQDAFDDPRKFYESISKESMQDEIQEWFDSLSTTDIQKIGSDVNEFSSLLEQTPEVQDQIKTYYTFNVLQNQGVDPAKAYDLTFDGHLNSAMGLTKEDYFMNQKDELRSWSDDYYDIMKEEPDVTKLPDEYYELQNHDKLNFGGDSKASEYWMGDNINVGRPADAPVYPDAPEPYLLKLRSNDRMEYEELKRANTSGMTEDELDEYHERLYELERSINESKANEGNIEEEFYNWDLGNVGNPSTLSSWVSYALGYNFTEDEAREFWKKKLDGGWSTESITNEMVNTMNDDDFYTDRYRVWNPKPWGFDRSQSKSFNDLNEAMAYADYLSQIASEEDGDFGGVVSDTQTKEDVYIGKSRESKSNEGRFRVADQGENTIHDTLEKARAHAEITGSPIWDMDKKEYVWLDSDWVGEGGYGSGKNSHGFGHKKWMRGAELNDDIIDAEDMHRNQFLPMQVEESTTDNKTMLRESQANREEFEQWWRTLSTSERDDFKIKLEPYVHDADYIENGDYDSTNRFYRHWYNNIRKYEPSPARRRHYR